MSSLRSWVDNRIIWAQFLPIFHFPLDIFAFICILDLFSFMSSIYPPIWFGAFFYILFVLVLFLATFRLQAFIPTLKFFHFSFSIKVLGIMQCFVFLSFLPPLTNFGSVTLIPVGIRVLDVEHP